MRTIIHKTTLLMVVILVFHTSLSAQGYWTHLVDCSAVTRDLSSGFAIADYGYICGGKLQNGTFTTDLLRYDPLSDSWTPKASMPFGAAGGVSFVINGKGYFTTGNTQFGGLTELYSYNPIPNVWSVLTPFPGNSRQGAVSFSLPGKGYAGLGGDGGTVFFNDLYEFNTITSTWVPKASFPGTPRIYSAYFSIGSKGYLLSGESSSGYLGDVWEYDQTTDSWSQKSNFPGAPRIGSTCFSIGNFGYVMGGEDNNHVLLSDFWQYNALTDTWTSMPAFTGIPRRDAASFAVGTKGYVSCGFQPTALLSDLWSWTPSGVGIENTNTIEAVQLYPNPGDGNLSLQFSEISDKEIHLIISDVSGRMVYTELLNPSPGISNYKLDVTFLPAGFYFLKLSGSKTNVISKIQLIK